jgi:hypothetical protein
MPPQPQPASPVCSLASTSPRFRSICCRTNKLAELAARRSRGESSADSDRLVGCRYFEPTNSRSIWLVSGSGEYMTVPIMPRVSRTL